MNLDPIKALKMSINKKRSLAEAEASAQNLPPNLRDAHVVSFMEKRGYVFDTAVGGIGAATRARNYGWWLK